MTDVEDALIRQAWAAVTGDGRPPPHLELTGDNGSLPSVLAAEPLAVASVAVALLSAAALHEHRTGRRVRVGVDRRHVADAVRSERFFRLGGRPAGSAFAALSKFWPTADGWIRTHGNYPWHRAALLRAVGAGPDPDVVGAAMARLQAGEVEERTFAEGGVAAGVRTPAAWRAHPQGRAVNAEDLVGHAVLPGAAPRERTSSTGLPATGIRVLDLTRVIAGPVCTRFLGALGASVLRLDPVEHDDLPRGLPADTLLGKRSAALDFAGARGVEMLHALLDSADVLVCGYRPGALDRFGLGDDELARRHPGLVTVRLAAWGHSGPWAQRRGFDSVVQAGVGIAAEEADATGAPGALPCQLLDHGTGYLAAAAALDGLSRQATGGGTHVRRASLARTGAWLLAGPRFAPGAAPPRTTDRLIRLDAPRGAVDAVAPPGRIDGVALAWPEPVSTFLDDPPLWP